MLHCFSVERTSVGSTCLLSLGGWAVWISNRGKDQDELDRSRPQVLCTWKNTSRVQCLSEIPRNFNNLYTKTCTLNVSLNFAVLFIYHVIIYMWYLWPLTMHTNGFLFAWLIQFTCHSPAVQMATAIFSQKLFSYSNGCAICSQKILNCSNGCAIHSQKSSVVLVWR